MRETVSGRGASEEESRDIFGKVGQNLTLTATISTAAKYKSLLTHIPYETYRD